MPSTIDPPAESTSTATAPVGAVTDDPIEPGQLESEGMRELEQMAEEGTERQDQPKPKKTAKTEPKKPDPKAKEEADPEPDPTDATPAEKPVKAAELRTAYEKSKADLKTKDAEITRLNTELKKAKEAPKDDPDKKLLVEKYEATEKRLQEAQQKLRAIAYQEDEEFIKKFKKPYEEGWAKAVEEIQEYAVELEDGSQRAGTAKDLLAIAQLGPKEARDLAKKLFGDDAASDIMSLRRKLRELSDAQNNAIEESKKNAETFHKEQQTKSLQERQKTHTLWTDENKRWTEKFPSFFAPKEGDAEGNALLAKGYEMADKAFSSNGDTTPEQRVKLHAELRNKAAGFPRMALQLKKARARIKELETSLAEFEQSEPPAGDGGKGRKPGSVRDEMMDGYSELDRMAKE